MIGFEATNAPLHAPGPEVLRLIREAIPGPDGVTHERAQVRNPDSVVDPAERAELEAQLDCWLAGGWRRELSRRAPPLPTADTHGWG